MTRLSHVFLGTFLVALIVQSIVWRNYDFVDRDMWIKHTEHFQLRDAEVFDPTVYGHPGTPAMNMAVIARTLFSLPYAQALLGSMAVLNALSIAGVAVVCKKLRPHHAWWLVASMLLIFNRLYLASTPPTAVVAPLIVLIILYALLIYESTQVKFYQILTLGGLLGISGATRADISAVIALALVFLLLPHIGWRKIIFTLAIAFVVFVAANPFMWYMPIQHINDLVRVVHYHYVDYVAASLPLLVFLLISPLAMVSFLLALALALSPQNLPQPTSRYFLGWLLLVTVIISTILLNAALQSPRYFFPLAFIWEIFLPLFLLTIIPRVRFTFLHEEFKQRRLQHLVQVAILTLLGGGQVIMMLHLMLMPDIVIVCGREAPPWQRPFCGQHLAAILW